MKLRHIAHSRAGDKGNIANLSVILFDEQDYAFLEAYLTESKVKEFLKNIVKGKVVRYELPHIAAFNFVLYDALQGGVTRSLSIDKHGKTLSSVLLELDIDEKEYRTFKKG